MPEPAPAVAASTPLLEDAPAAEAPEEPPATALLASALVGLPEQDAVHGGPPDAAEWAAQADLFEREAGHAAGGRTAAELLFEAGRLRDEHLDDLSLIHI